jgi:hypothetical protein
MSDNPVIYLKWPLRLIMQLLAYQHNLKFLMSTLTNNYILMVIIQFKFNFGYFTFNVPALCP